AAGTRRPNSLESALARVWRRVGRPRPWPYRSVRRVSDVPRRDRTGIAPSELVATRPAATPAARDPSATRGARRAGHAVARVTRQSAGPGAVPALSASHDAARDRWRPDAHRTNRAVVGDAGR